MVAVAKGSDSDNSGETNSLSAESGELRPAPALPTTSQRKHRNNRCEDIIKSKKKHFQMHPFHRRRGSEWEVLEGLKDGQRFDRRPEVFNGFLHKKRKWPLKGWHKVFIIIDHIVFTHFDDELMIAAILCGGRRSFGVCSKPVGHIQR